MSWFESSAFASLAKSAIKEAQKTIDKALDIHDGQEKLPVTKDVKSHALEEETEMFFKSFEKFEEDKKLLNDTIQEEIEDLDSKNIKFVSSESKNTLGTPSIMGGSIWGSFAESFFENTIANAKEFVSSKNKTDKFPEHLDATDGSKLPDSHLRSSNSSSVVELSGDAESPSSLENIPNVVLDNYITEEISKEDNLPPSVKDCDLDWGWDSSIIVMTSDSSTEDLIIGISPVEASLVDDLTNNDDFAHSHLTFEKACSLDGQKSNLENDFQKSVLDGVSIEPSSNKPTDPDIPSISFIANDEHFVHKSIDITTSNSVHQLGIYDSNTLQDFVNSIISVNSVPTSQFEAPISVITKDIPSGDNPISNLIEFQNMPGSIEVIDFDTVNSLSSNSIELLSPTSSDNCTPINQDLTTLLSTENLSLVPSENYGSRQVIQQFSNEDSVAPVMIFLVDESVKCHNERIWSQEESESITITKQPISVTTHQKLSPLLGKDVEEKIDTLEENQSYTTSYTSEEGSTSESIHSTSTSSTHTVIDSNICPSEEMQIMNLSEISDRCEEASLNVKSSVDQEQGQELVSTDATAISPSLNSTQLRAKGAFSMNPLNDNNKLTKLSPVEHLPNIEHDKKFIKNELCIKVLSSDKTFNDCLTVGSRLTFQSETLENKIVPSTSCHLWDELPTLDICTADTAKRKKQNKNTNLSEQGVCDESKESNNITMEVKELIIDRRSSEAERELSPSSSDRSDVLKVCSSGHSSADEVETTTSSDIEVISSPSMDGSNGTSSRLYNMPTGVSSKAWLTSQKGHCSMVLGKGEAFPSFSTNKKDGNIAANEKGEAFPSSMTTSFTSISESDGDCQHLSHSELLQLEASRVTQVLLQDSNSYGKGHCRNKSTVSETSESSSEPHSPELDKLYKKITRLTDILEARETKVLELSLSNSALLDSIQALKSRIEELEMLKIGSDSTESIREEFTQRLVTMERKFQQALREKEFAKKQLEECVAEAATRRSNAEVAKELEEKNTIIQELRHEGEQLSKQQLNYSNIIKKLRTKEKEFETCIKDQKEKIESQSTELDRFRKQLNAKEEVERCQIDAIRQLTVVSQRQEVEVKDLRAENAEAEGKLIALKDALDTAYREMTDMQRAAATRDAEAHEQTLSADVSAKQKIETAVLDATRQNKREQETLLAQIHELQDSLSQAEMQSNRMERQMKHEICDLQQRLSESESRAEDMSNSVSSATRSLLGQIENIQAGHNLQRATWDSLEESLNKRLNEALGSAAYLTKREREAKEQHMILLETTSSLQTQVSSLQTENSKLVSQIETLTAKTSELENTKSRESFQLEAIKRSFTEEILEVKRERDILEQQLKIEKLSVNAEKKKTSSLQEQLKDKDKKLSQLHLSTITAGESKLSSPRSSPTPSLSRLSITGSINESYGGSHWGDEVFDSTWVNTKGSVYDNLRGNSAATVDVLTSTLQQREGELSQLQTELIRLDGQKESLAQELVQTSRKIIELSSQVQDYEKMKEMHLDIEQKYNALLQMYGEKVEEVDELKLDLADVKEMYKLQIDQLMRK